MQMGILLLDVDLLRTIMVRITMSLSMYHPLSPGLEEIDGINDSMSESINNILDRYAVGTLNMGRARFNAYVLFIPHLRNCKI